MIGRTKFPRLAPLGIGLALATILLLGATARPSDPNSVELSSGNPPALNAQQIQKRQQWYAERLGLQFGVPTHARADAIAQAAHTTHPGTTQASSLPNAASLTWNNIGPLPMTEASNFGGVILGSAVAMTGRVSAIAVDPANAANIAIGGANGGVWISTDTGAHFAPVFDAEPSQAIGALAFDTTTSPSTLWAGTGEGNNAVDTYYGQGLYKSANLGSSWTPVGGSTFDRAAFSKIAVDNSFSPAHIFLALSNGSSAGRSDPYINETNVASQGLYRSIDDGASFSQYSGTVFGCFVDNDAGPCPANDVAADGSLVAVAIDFDNVFVSTNGGTTFTAATFPSLTLGPGALNQTFRQSVAIANSTTVYAMVGDASGGAYLGLFESTNSGGIWTAKTVPSATPGNVVTIDGISDSNFAQSFYDQFLIASKLTPGTIAFGGVGPYLSTNSGTSWSFLGSGGGIHSDQHAAALNPAGSTLYIGNDGGAYAVNLTSQTITSLNTDIDVGQIQGIGPNPTDGSTLIAGFQDNGTQIYSGTSNFTFAETGDGGFALYDHADPTYAYHTFATSGGPVISRSTDSGATWDFGTPTTNLDNALSGAGDRGANFYPPLASDPGTAHRVLFGAQFIYVSNDGMLTWSRQSTTDLTSGSCGDASCDAGDVEFSPVDNTKAWAVAMNSGGSGFEISNTTQANLNSGAAWTNQTAPFNSAAGANANINTQITGVTPDPFNADTAYVTLSGFKAATGVSHIFKTTNFGTSWTNVSGDLTDVPVLRLLVDNQDATGNTLLAATDIGVFRSVNGGVNWTLFNQGVIPSVPVFDIEESSNGVIYAGSHGRGAYKLVTGSASPTPTPTATPTPAPTPTPVPVLLKVAPKSLNFGKVKVGKSKKKNLTIMNPAKKNGPTVTFIGDGTISAPYTAITQCIGALPAKRKCHISVDFTPSSVGSFPGQIHVSSNAENGSLAISIQGSGK